MAEVTPAAEPQTGAPAGADDTAAKLLLHKDKLEGENKRYRDELKALKAQVDELTPLALRAKERDDAEKS